MRITSFSDADNWGLNTMYLSMYCLAIGGMYVRLNPIVIDGNIAHKTCLINYDVIVTAECHFPENGWTKFPRVMKSIFLLQPQHEYYITQYEDVSFLSLLR